MRTVVKPAPSRMPVTGVTPENPQVTALLKRRDEARAKVDAVLARRAAADAATDGRELETALVDLVVVTLQVRRAGAGGKP